MAEVTGMSELLPSTPHPQGQRAANVRYRPRGLTKTFFLFDSLGFSLFVCFLFFKGSWQVLWGKQQFYPKSSSQSLTGFT